MGGVFCSVLISFVRFWSLTFFNYGFFLCRNVIGVLVFVDGGKGLWGVIFLY